MKIAPRPASSRLASIRCAYCHEGLGGPALICPDCSTLVHEECELPQCPTLGCGSAAPWEWTDVRPPRPDRSRQVWALAAGLWLTAGAAVWAAWRPAGTIEAREPEPARAAAEHGEETDPSPPTWWFVTRTESRRVSWYSGPAWCGTCLPSDAGIQVVVVEDAKGRVSGWRHRVYAQERRYRSQGGLTAVVFGTRTLADGPFRADLELAAQPRRLLAARSGVNLSVPAGAFTCVYLKEAALTARGQPAQVETWTVPGLPLPIQRVVTWRAQHDPDAPESSERCVLLSASRD
ncbi:MAG: hypothetical protein AB7N76_28565 [Planctomycetota bacterium]